MNKTLDNKGSYADYRPMYIERVPNRNSPPAILLRESYREDGKVRKRTLLNLSGLPEHAIAALKHALETGEFKAGGGDDFEIVKSMAHGHVHAVLGMMKSLGIADLLHTQKSRERDLCLAMIAARIIGPASKLSTARAIDEQTQISSLADQLELGQCEVEELYAAMDWLLVGQQRIENKLAQRHLKNGSMILYDLSGSYVEGSHCPLAAFGHNRDGKKGKMQIVYGLLCDNQGRPIAIEVFKGNTADPNTVPAQVEKLRERFKLKNVIMVGDRGMLTQARINENLKTNAIDWISALRSDAIDSLREEGLLQLSLFDERDLFEIQSQAHPGERLIACLNPLLQEERARKREALLQATEEQLKQIAASASRQKRPLRGKDKIALRVGKIIQRHKMAKHFILDIGDDFLHFSRDLEAIKAESALDGIYVVRTSVASDVLDAPQTVEAYKNLSKVERAFRSIKTIDLKIRPIYHYAENRVRAHVFLCMLAYYVEWHMREKLAPILFEDTQIDLANKERPSVVAKSRRSIAAQTKDASKRTDSDLPVHSFGGLIDNLGSIVLNFISYSRFPQTTLRKVTVPNQLQRKAFRLLEISDPS